jgi:hypothetical protein
LLAKEKRLSMGLAQCISDAGELNIVASKKYNRAKKEGEKVCKLQSQDHVSSSATSSTVAIRAFPLEGDSDASFSVVKSPFCWLLVSFWSLLEGAEFLAVSVSALRSVHC